MESKHYYVYYTKIEKGVEVIIYERTCGTEQGANDRVGILTSGKSFWGKVHRAFWSNDTVKGAFY